MSDFSSERLEARLIEAGHRLAYPPTPDVARRLSLRPERIMGRRRVQRRLAAAAVLSLLVVLTGLLAVPPVRAAVLEFLQIGVVRIFPVAPSATPTQHATPQPASTLLPSLLGLAGEVPIDQLPDRTDLPVMAPTFPRDFGSPDYAFIQDLGGDVLVLVWIDPQQPSEIELSLHMLSPGSWGIDKYEPQVVAETEVNGQAAIWATGPYLLRSRTQDSEVIRLVEGHVLIWVQDGLTYRLESGWTMEEAVQAAESLQLIK